MEYIIAFIGGIITFISPCILPLIPLYIAFIAGISVKSLEEKNKPIFSIFVSSLFFVLGFTLVFSILAFLFYIIISQLGSYKIWFNRIAGLIIIIFGIHMTGLIKIPFLNYEMKYSKKINKGFFTPLLMGMAFGAGWTPCIGPILSGILFSSASSERPELAMLQLIIYSLGLGIPFILTGLLTNKVLSIFSFIKKHYKIIEIISGIFVIALGLIILTDKMGWLSGVFSRALPFLNNVESIIY